MPAELINRVDEEEVQVKAGLMEFVIRKHYEPLYSSLNDRRNGVIGTPGVAKSVSLLYPLLKHFTPHVADKSFEKAPPVVIHSVLGGQAFIFLEGLFSLKVLVGGLPTSNPSSLSVRAWKS